MEKLLQPDVGLMVWTVATFLVVLFVLGKFAWGPILGALDDREKGLQSTLSSAEESRQTAEKLRQDYEARLAQIEQRTRDMMAQAQIEAQRTREEALKSAQAETEKLIQKTRDQLAEEQQRLVRELRAEVADLSVRSTERLIHQTLDRATQEKLLDGALVDFDQWAQRKS